MLRILRVAVGLLLIASGGLMFTASWQRWAGACGFWDQNVGPVCDARQDHLLDFAPPTVPWEPVGDAAQLAGWSMLVLAAAFLLLPWALTGRRPGIVAAVALVGAVLAQVALGVATLRSGLTANVVEPISGDLALYVWLLVPLGVLIRFAFDARGWTLGAAACLVVADPLVAGFTYGIGSYDTRPWYEAISGTFAVVAGVCLMVAAVSRRSGLPEGATTESSAPADAASSP